MDETTTVGVRELKANLSRYLGQVRTGGDVIVTDRGQPIARIVGLGTPPDRLADLIARGIAHAPKRASRKLPKRVKASASVSELVADQRR